MKMCATLAVPITETQKWRWAVCSPIKGNVLCKLRTGQALVTMATVDGTSPRPGRWTQCLWKSASPEGCCEDWAVGHLGNGDVSLDSDDSSTADSDCSNHGNRMRVVCRAFFSPYVIKDQSVWEAFVL